VSDDPPEEDDRAPQAPPPDEPKGVAPVGAEKEEEPANLLQQRARLAEDRLAEVLSAYRELKAENEDYRDRLARNVERRFEQRRERLLLKFIDVLDNLERALEAAQTTYAGDAMVEGMILVRTHLLQTLQIEGLDRIPVLGLPFDPNFSESVGTQPVKDADHDHLVVKELLRGYRINGRVARPSRVMIGVFTGEQPEGVESTPPAAEPVAESSIEAPPLVEGEPGEEP
jgi:molecular chaperone GrpE